MSYDNFVQCQLVLPLAATATSITLVAAVAPYRLPPTGGGYLVLTDSPNRPSAVEIISYTSRAGLVLSGVTRGLDSTTARLWSGTAVCYQALLAGDFQAKLDAKVDAVGGKQLSTEDYSSADKSKLAGVATGTAAQTALGLKVNNSDIVDDLMTASATKVLSAKQGKVLNDALTLTRKSSVVTPVSGVLDLSAFTGIIARVSLTANVTSIVLPGGTADLRNELIIEFTNTGNFTVSGWPTAPTLRVATQEAPPAGVGAGVVTQYALSNTDNAGWLMHGQMTGNGQTMLKVPSGQRLVAGASGCTALSTAAQVAARVSYIPFTVARPMTLSALGISVATLLAGTATLGIYDSDGDATYDYPGTRLASTVQGLISTNATGSKLASLSITLVPEHVYYAAVVTSAAVTLRAVQLAGIQPCLGFTDNSTTAVTMYTSVSTGNVLPATAGSLSAQVTSIPAIYLVEVL